MSAEVELLREAARRLRGQVVDGNPNPWARPAMDRAVADLLEDEAERAEDTPYRVDSDWIERNYRAPLTVARAVLGREA
jgi:hypothetical protein